jgi:phage-related baseplate assembly protein
MSTLNGITDFDVAGLPAPAIVEEISFEAILASLVEDFEARWPEWDVGALETDPAKMILEVAAYRETILRARMNDVARANLLAFARGTDLDQLAAFYDLVRLVDEDDVRFRKRIILAIAGRSTGGTSPRYRLVAMSADVRIADAVAWVDVASPVVRISVLSSVNGGAPYPEMLAAVEAAVNHASVKMVNDTIVVEGAVFQTVNITADVWMLPSSAQAAFDGLEAELRAAWIAEAGLGFDLTPAWITARLMRPGVQKVLVTAPVVDQVVKFHQAIALGTITLTNKGRAF